MCEANSQPEPIESNLSPIHAGALEYQSRKIWSLSRLQGSDRAPGRNHALQEVLELGAFQPRTRPEGPMMSLTSKPLGEQLFEVESENHPGRTYVVDMLSRTCTCPHYRYRGAICKHIRSVEPREPVEKNFHYELIY